MTLRSTAGNFNILSHILIPGNGVPDTVLRPDSYAKQTRRDTSLESLGNDALCQDLLLLHDNDIGGDMAADASIASYRRNPSSLKEVTLDLSGNHLILIDAGFPTASGNQQSLLVEEPGSVSAMGKPEVEAPTEHDYVRVLPTGVSSGERQLMITRNVVLSLSKNSTLSRVGLEVSQQPEILTLPERQTASIPKKRKLPEEVQEAIAKKDFHSQREVISEPTEMDLDKRMRSKEPLDVPKKRLRNEALTSIKNDDISLLFDGPSAQQSTSQEGGGDLDENFVDMEDADQDILDLPHKKRMQKSLPDSSGDSEEEGSETQEGDNYEKQERRDLPHKKRIPRKLKQPHHKSKLHIKSDQENPTGKVFKTESGLATHTGLHHGGEQRNRNAMGIGGLDDFVCLHCGKQLKNQLQLRNHIAKVHPNADEDDGNKCLHASTHPASSFSFSVQASTLSGALRDGQEDQISQENGRENTSRDVIYEKEKVTSAAKGTKKGDHFLVHGAETGDNLEMPTRVSSPEAESGISKEAHFHPFNAMDDSAIPDQGLHNYVIPDRSFQHYMTSENLEDGVREVLQPPGILTPLNIPPLNLNITSSSLTPGSQSKDQTYITWASGSQVSIFSATSSHSLNLEHPGNPGSVMHHQNP
ncbi:unnamed protein product [Darwinula stevensoni]|uniref:C2H2-type domain-containing protein n=1 Tax=Darwinula stevensoni TaxID=69355 RepID=A0A7R9A1D8_9CRUS|nr:unnamed protein product [Darwinula stevensoni]CAG0883261.1 unnamed protein product [Darwinula stevensoni]